MEYTGQIIKFQTLHGDPLECSEGYLLSTCNVRLHRVSQEDFCPSLKAEQ